MSELKDVYFAEYHVEGCCGMVELSGISKEGRVTWKVAAKQLTEWLDSHGIRDDNSGDVWDYMKKKYVQRVQNFTYGRRLIITSIKNGQKDLIDGLCHAGWHALTEFPGNHGNYKLTLLGYTPKTPNNAAWFAGTMVDGDGNEVNDNWGDDGDEEYDNDY